MRVQLTTPTEGLTLGDIYRVAVIHAEGYELRGITGRYPVGNFEIIQEDGGTEN